MREPQGKGETSRRLVKERMKADGWVDREGSSGLNSSSGGGKEKGRG